MAERSLRDVLKTIVRLGPRPGMVALLEATGLDLRTDFEYADFTDCDCSGLDFSHARLRGAQFLRANLLGCRFDHADLADADFSAAIFRDAAFRNADVSQAVFTRELHIPPNWELPSLDLLDDEDPESETGLADWVESIARGLESQFDQFKVPAKVAEVVSGPVISRFEVEPAAGVRASRLAGLTEDLARLLGVSGIRFLGMVPGKRTVGFEIPNDHRQTVRARSLLGSREFRSTGSPLTVAIGADISGDPVVSDLARLPHLLMAGSTGSGNSMQLNALLLSILYKATPEDVRLILVDPKMLELLAYADLPHLLTPIISDMSAAARALRWCVDEMERRYRLLAAAGKRNLDSFNATVRDSIDAGAPLSGPTQETGPIDEPDQDDGQIGLTPLPQIVIVIDELADVMMVVGKRIEELIARLAQKSRAAGIHLVVATQRPSVDVVTGVIKANIPCRISFQTRSKVDSRTILDQIGAEQLLGDGDMLYLAPGSQGALRVQGAYISEHELNRVIECWKKQGAPAYQEAVTAVRADARVPDLGIQGSSDDPLYAEAARYVIESRSASVSAMQRKLRVGYSRAARLLEDMEKAGLVSPANANGRRAFVTVRDR